MFFTSDPYRAAQTTRMNNVVELHQQTIARHAHTLQQTENAHRRTVRSLEDEIEEVQRYRARVVAERNALRDQLAEAQRSKRIQGEALLRAFQKIEAQRQAVAYLHQAWAPALDDIHPLKTERQVVAFIRQAREALACNEQWREGALRQIEDVCAQIAEKDPHPSAR
jgi:hypothetical protein